MLKKLLLTLMVITNVGFAQNSYRTDNYSDWKVLEANSEDKYLLLEAKDQELLRQYKPLCTNTTAWIFKYQMMGHDDSYYTAGSQPRNVKYLKNSGEYTVKIDIEQDNIYSKEETASSQRICSENKAQMYFDRQNNSGSHGIITYVGDKNALPPF